MKIAIIGAGNMGGAIAVGLRDSGLDKLSIAISNRSASKLHDIKAYDRNGILAITTDNKEVVKDANIVILAVKPWVLPDVIHEISEEIARRRPIIISLAGGVSLDRIDEMLKADAGKEFTIYRVIPNTAIAVDKGMTFISGRRCSKTSDVDVSVIFGQFGETAFIEERLMDAATALSSCGIAYVFKFVQAFVQAGVEMGFTPSDALDYTLATIEGAAELLRTNQDTPQEEIDKVTTPGGMTIRGINELEHRGFTSAVVSAILKPLKK